MWPLTSASILVCWLHPSCKLPRATRSCPGRSSQSSRPACSSASLLSFSRGSPARAFSVALLLDHRHHRHCSYSLLYTASNFRPAFLGLRMRSRHATYHQQLVHRCLLLAQLILYYCLLNLRDQMGGRSGPVLGPSPLPLARSG